MRASSRVAVATLSALIFVSSVAAAQVAPWKRHGRKRRVYFDSTPQQAAVYIEKESYGIACYTPCSLRLPYKRTFQVFLKKPGFQTYKGTILVARRRRDRRYRFVLKREIQPGFIDVRSDTSGSAVSGRIVVDGLELGTVPSRVSVKPGRHELEVRRKGYKPWRQWVDLAERQVFTVVVTLEPAQKPTGSILVTSDPVGAEVFVDGKRTDTTPCVVQKLLPGAHTVEVRMQGKPVWKQIIEVKAGAQVKVVAKLDRSPPRPTAHTGAVRVLSNVPKADVYVDGDYKGPAPITAQGLLPGDHLVEVRAKGYKPAEARIKVVAKQQTLVKLDLEAKPEEKPMGIIRVVSEVPGADVFVDGELVGKAPIKERRLDVGQHIVIVRKPGYRDYKITLSRKKNETRVITAALKAVGTIKVVTPVAGAQVFIDSVKIGKTPLEGYELEAGDYTMEVRMPGGKFEPYRTTFSIKGGEHKSFPVELRPVRVGPTPEEVAFVTKGLSSFSARTVPPKKFTTDIGFGFPYIVAANLTVGAWKHKMFGIDAGISFRSLFLYMNEFSVHARGQLFEKGPFSLGLFTELGAGIGLARRNSFFWNIGPVLTLSFKNIVTASLALWFNVYSDRICRSSPADPDAGETEPDICALTEGWPTDPDGVGPRDTANNTGVRNAPYQVVNDGGQTKRVYLQPKLFGKHSLRDRFNGWKFVMSFIVEVAIIRNLNIFVKMDLVPAQDAQQRALFMEFYTASDYTYHDDPVKPRVDTKGVLTEVDWGFYSQAGVSFKF